MKNRYRRTYSKKIKKNELYAYLVLIFIMALAAIRKYNTDLFNISLLIVLLIFFLSVLANVLSIRVKKRKLLNSRIHEIDHMTGIEFEQLLAAHFKENGYKVSLTKKSNDYGGDLLIKKDGVTTVVQAKRYKNKVGISAVQEAYAAVKHYGADYSMVITNSFFTTSAKRLAEETDVELWDREKLTETFKIK